MPRAGRLPSHWPLGLVSLLLWASLACGALSAAATSAPPTQSAGTATPGAPPATEASTATASSTAPPSGTATPAPPPTQPGELVIEQSLTFGAGPLIYTDTLTGLAALVSYQAQLTVTFAGTRDGQAEQWTRTYVMLARNDPPARLWTIEGTGDLPEPGSVLVAELDGAAYERHGEAACTANAVEPGNSPAARLELAGLLTGVIGADEAGTETLGDVPAAHYTFDQRALGEAGLTESSGELWLAVEGGALLRYRLTSTGGPDYFGPGVEGTLTLDYELSGINEPVALALPEDCPPGLVNAPLLPDAADVFSAPGLLTYATAEGVEAVVAFYQEQLPGLGWVANGDPAMGEVGALLSFTQGEQQLTVSASAEAGLTTVNLSLARLPK